MSTKNTMSDDIATRDRDAERGLLQSYVEKLKSGDLGSLPVIVGVIVVWIVFYTQNSNFLTAFNLTNLSLQIAAVGIVAIGVVLVLLLGEIDLSVGSVSGLCAAIAVVLNLQHGMAGVPAIILGVLAGGAIGMLQGLIVTKIEVPSFVVTLAGLIGWQGAQLWILSPEGSQNVTDRAMLDLTNTFFGPAASWTIVIVALVAMVGLGYMARVRRDRAGLESGPWAAQVIRYVIISGVAIGACIVWNQDRGMPLAVLILIGLSIVFDLMVRRTPFGRHIFAVGGNAEAARRAGISVPRIRTLVFTLSGLLAAFGGIMAASRVLAVNQASGGGQFLLTAIASAVIGGTSLFGGRGSVWSAVLGALVLGSVANGIALLGLESSYEFMITALVLLAATVVDATARRGRRAAGR